MKSWIVLNVNGLFKPNSFNKVVEARLRQTGSFVDSSHVVQALQDGLRRAVDRVLTTTTPNIHDQDRLYFTLSSNRLTSNFQGWDYALVNGEKEESAWMPLSIV